MSLPDVPNTLREKYYSVMAGQNDADILPDIETAPSTENRYLDYIARNGGGGGGDVTKEYVDEQDAKKTDKVTSAISGNFAGLDENGNLTDSGKNAADFATASDMTAVQGVIPSTATTSNKLATASDVTGEDISSTSTTSPITDSADGMVQGLTIYGRTESGSSVGDNGLMVQTIGKNLLKITINDIKPNNVGGTWTGNVYEYQGITYTFEETNGYVSAIILNGTSTNITGLRGISSIIMPKNVHVLSGVPNGTAETFYVGLYTDANMDPRWSYYKINNHSAIQGISTPNKWNKIGRLMYVGIYVNEGIELTNLRFELMYTTVENYELDPAFEPYCSTSATVTTALPLRSNGDVKDEIDFADGVTITRIDSNGDVLATPVVTPLTTAEISAFRSLRTYDSTTNITITDEPDFELDYLKNTDNGEAVGKIQDDLQGQINGLAIKTLTYTGTGTTTNSITFPDKPLMVLGYTQDSDYDAWVRGIMPFFFHPSTAMLRVFWKNKSETSHASDYTYSSSYVLTINGNSISWTGSDASQALNANGVEYTVYYI